MKLLVIIQKMDANNSDEVINNQLHSLDRRWEAADLKRAEISRKRKELQAARKRETEIMEQNLDLMNQRLETLRRQKEVNDREISELEAEKQILINEKLSRLDLRQKAAELRSAEISRERGELEAECKYETETMEQYRQYFILLNREREIQRLEMGKIDPNLKEELNLTARLGESMERNLDRVNQRLDALKNEAEIIDREVREMEAEKQILVKNLRDLKLIEIFRNFLNDK